MAVENKMSSIALTDHGSMFGIFKFFNTAQRAGIKPIVGSEVYVAQRSRHDKVAKMDDDQYHLVLLAKDRTGYQNLIKLVSLANTEGFYYKPRIDFELLETFHEGLIATTACLGGQIPRLLYNKKIKEATELAMKYEKLFGKGNYYLELQPNRMKEQEIVNKRLMQLSKDTGIPLTVATDAHYPTEQDAFTQDVLLAINTKKKIKDTDRLTMVATPDFYLWKEDQVLDFFGNSDEIKEAVANTARISDLCNVDIMNKDWILPVADIPSEYNKNADKYLHDLSFQRAQTRLGRELNEEESKRLDYELNIFAEKGFSSYMLMVSEFTDWMIERDIPFTTRGSAAGSFVAFATGVVNANPLNFSLNFERFLNPLRPKAPDIDLDVAASVRDELVKYTIQKHGEDRVAHIVTFGRMQARGSIRDAGRVLDLPLDYVDNIAKLIPTSGQGLKKVTIKSAIEAVSELKQLIEKDPNAGQLIDVAKQIEGKARNIGIHACGILVTPAPITDYVPVVVDKDSGRMVTQYTMDDIEELKLIKVDFLGLTNLDTIRETIRLVKESREVDISLEDIKLDDNKVYQTVCKLDTLGIFQLESDVMKQTIRTIKPETIFDLSAVNALVRPGPNQYQKEYAMRKEGKKPIEYLDPRMEKFLSRSFGVLVYQEDIIKAVIELAGMDWGEADKVRKATGKKKPDVLFEMKEELITRFVEHGMTEENANKLFELFIPFTNYAFNQAHAASYALITYYTSWLKTYFEVEFVAALLKTEIGDKDMITKVLEECVHKGINVLPPDINKSQLEYSIEDKTNIRIGLGAIKGISRKSVENIVDIRREKGLIFESLDHLLHDLKLVEVPVKTFELLIQVGALDEFGDRGALLQVLPALYKKYRDEQEQKMAGMCTLFGGGKGEEKKIINKTPLPSTIITPNTQKIQWEKDLIGIYITEHPLISATGFVEKYKLQTTLSVGKEQKNKSVTILGQINNIKKISTKNGDPMAFVKLEDLDGFVEVVIFPKIYEKYSSLLKSGGLIVVRGKINERNDEFTLLADQIKEITPEVLEKYKVKPKEDKKVSDNLLKISIPKQFSKDELLKLKELIAQNPGDTKVLIEIETENEPMTVEVKSGISVGDWCDGYKCCLVS